MYILWSVRVAHTVNRDQTMLQEVVCTRLKTIQKYKIMCPKKCSRSLTLQEGVIWQDVPTGRENFGVFGWVVTFGEVVAFGGSIVIYRNLVQPGRKQHWLLNTVYVNSFNRPLREHISTRNAPLQETSAFVDVFWLALLQAWKWNAQLSSGGTTYTLSRSTTDMRSGIRIFLPIFHLASGRLPGCVLTQKVELIIKNISSKYSWLNVQFMRLLANKFM